MENQPTGDDSRKKVMNNLNLDTTRQHETMIMSVPSPVTPQEQCFSPVPRDHRREKSDSICLEGTKSDSEDTSFIIDSPRPLVGEHSFDLNLQEPQRNRSQSQIDPSLFLGDLSAIPGEMDNPEIALDFNKPDKVLSWFTIQVRSFIGVSFEGACFSF